MFVCLVAGTRTLSDYPLVRATLDHDLADHLPDVTIRTGGRTRGADGLACRYADERDLGLQVYEADWVGLGRRAGIMRTLRMYDGQADDGTREGIPHSVVAFWDGASRGTMFTIKVARMRRIPLRIVRV